MSVAKGNGGMGFRNLKDFNTALLAKQCWRLIHEPDSLLARMLKDWYFPHVSFLDAKWARGEGGGEGVLGLVKLAGREIPHYSGR